MSSKRFYIAEEVVAILVVNIPWYKKGSGSDFSDDS